MEKKRSRFNIPSSKEIEHDQEKQDSNHYSGQMFKKYKESKDNESSESGLISKTSSIDTKGKASTSNSDFDGSSGSLHVSTDNSIDVTTKDNISKGSSDSKISERNECTKTSEGVSNLFRGATFAESFSYLKQSEYYEKPPEATMTSTVTSAENQTPKYKTNSIIVNPRQRGNPILKHVRNVPWEYGDVIPDYVLGQTQCALFLSLRYYNFNPEYIHERLKQLGNRYDLRILLVLVDIKDCQHALKELGKIAILSDCTLILSWSPEEAGRYLETYKSYENKPADVLQEKVEGDYLSKMTDCLTSVKSVNKTDVITLLSAFGSLQKVTVADKDELALCPGFGFQKADRLHKIFKEPFKKRKRRSIPDDTD